MPSPNLFAVIVHVCVDTIWWCNYYEVVEFILKGLPGCINLLEINRVKVFESQ